MVFCIMAIDTIADNIEISFLKKGEFFYIIEPFQDLYYFHSW